MPALRPARRLAAISTAVLASATLAGCATIVSLDPAPLANDPDCANVTVRLPDAVDALEKRETDAQASGAWGDPVSVILRCGVEVPGPSVLSCIEVAGVQWLRHETTAPNWIFTSYGRDPAIQIAVDGETIGPGVALDILSFAVSQSPRNGRECQSLEDTVTGSGG